ncbi:Peptidoglycan/LPS O-acetylase OafA/YrhL, contains acyltransferase and SGNH-hydrolase domains [Pseudomonas helmanticensis]|uniref:Peptidoglycan/LPS O-acetylase OafA/YrhL, contains acyltransferase and SGNH-hydrolase domains n=1 Tax=Pseudomonas helmanticensis TaxID=1471381 RepID=A0ACD2UCU2_9PSED|nr:acyltransferase [Pseudomonas helmanticensis]SMQ30085.1 Peptidoglycan/LPS O-acetylase OafA/YrhL, contains acyltransferase and SGNH-hydrolase domains [Pseudomonas helmanticensis]
MIDIKKPTTTLGDMVKLRANNFDLLRLCAALVVLITHSFALTGKSPATWYSLFMGYEPGSLAVSAFFAISGFLIAGSLERRTFTEYWQARALRIIPALAVTSFVSALILGPVFTALPLGEYFQNSGTYRYLTNSIPYQTAFVLPGVFMDVTYPQTVNGSLWTIPIEAFCYVALAAIFFVGRRTFSLVVPVMALISAFFVWLFFHGPIAPITFFGTTEVLPVLRFGLMFLVGTFLWKYKDIVPFKGSIAAMCLVVLLIGSRFGYTNLALFIALPYLLMYLAYRRPVCVDGMRKLGDLSYGTYLFAFPIQQALVSISHKSINGWWLAIAASVLSMGLAWFSWRYIEKPAMQFKKKFSAPVVLEKTA